MLNTPVHWGSYEPGLLELTMAVLLHQERPKSQHRQPSQGDGGVDVFDPLPDGRFDVYQIKGFTDRLSRGGRKKQIKDSLAAVVDNPRLPGDVRNWYLVLPLSLTSHEETWLRDLTGAAPFACDWLGATFWHGEASKYPYVIDYFLLNRREEVQQKMHTLLHMDHKPTDGEAGPLHVTSKLRDLASEVDRASPFYRFEYRLTQTMPWVDSVPGRVMSHVQGPDGGPFEVIDVIARFPQATEMEPITGTFQFNLPAGSDQHPGFAEAVEEWLEFGPELEIPQGLLSISLQAPGGLSLETTSAGGWIGTPDADTDATIRLRVEGGLDRADLMMKVISNTAGILGGREVHVRDDEGLLTVRFRFPVERGAVKVDLTTTKTDLSGRMVARLLPVTRFLASLTAGATVYVLPEVGTKPILTCPINEPFDVLDDQVVDLVTLLSRLQDKAAAPITYPSSLDVATYRDLKRADQLFEDGEVHRTWTEITVTFNGEVDGAQLDALRAPHALVLTDDLEIEMDGQTLEFGPAYRSYNSAVLDYVSEDLSTGRLVPGPDNRCVERVGALDTSAVQP
jgi:hypothetical protein